MNKERLECIMSGLDRYELTGLEKRFVQSVQEYYKEKSMLTEQQESILEGVYREKTGFTRKRMGRVPRFARGYLQNLSG